MKPRSLAEAYRGINQNRDDPSCWQFVIDSAYRIGGAVRHTLGLSQVEMEDVVSELLCRLSALTNRLPTDNPDAHLYQCLRNGAIDYLRANRRYVDWDDNHQTAESALAVTHAWGDGLGPKVNIDGGRVELSARIREACGDADGAAYLSWHECFALAGLPTSANDDSSDDRIAADRALVEHFAALRRASINTLVSTPRVWNAEGDGTLEGLRINAFADWRQWLSVVDAFRQEGNWNMPPTTGSLLEMLTSVVAGSPVALADDGIVAAARWLSQRHQTRLPLSHIFARRAFEERRMKVGLNFDGAPLDNAPVVSKGKTPPKVTRWKAPPMKVQLRVLVLRNAERGELANLPALLEVDNDASKAARLVIQRRFAKRHQRALELVDEVVMSTRDDVTLPAEVRRGVLIAAAVLHSESRRERVMKEYLIGSTLANSGESHAV